MEDSGLVTCSGTRFAEATIVRGGSAMTSKQHLTSAHRSEGPDAIDLAHINSELCWCDPILDFDDDGNESLTHNEVTWN
jgi:hypothetical protein